MRLKLINALFKSCVALIVANIIANVLVPLAAQERGYEGSFGGEWLLIIFVFVVTYKLVGYVERYIFETDNLK